MINASRDRYLGCFGNGFATLTEETIAKATAILAIMGCTLTRHPSGSTVSFSTGYLGHICRTDVALMLAVSKVVAGEYSKLF